MTDTLVENSKNTSTAPINSGGGNVHIGDITKIYGKSPEYQEFLDQIKEVEKDLKIIPLDEIEVRLAKSKKLEGLKKDLTAFKADVMRLAETFTKIEINTERLRQAKELFEEGLFRKADDILKVEEMSHEQDSLLDDREHQRSKLEDIDEKLRNNSNEFLIKAQITATDYRSPTRFEDSCKYFEQAIKSHANSKNLFKYAKFLQEHNQINEALIYYKKALSDFADTLAPSNKATTLNNLGILQKNNNEPYEAARSFNKALDIQRPLAETNYQKYLPDVAMTLNNLGNLHRNNNEFKKATVSYNEALAIYRKLARTNPQEFLPNIAGTLNNLGILQSNNNKLKEALKLFTEALEIGRKLAKTNPQAFLANMTMTLINLGNLQTINNELDQAAELYNEALEIHRKLAEENPQAYMPNVATTLNNLGNLQCNTNKLDKAEISYNETLAIRRKLAKDNPQAYLPDMAGTLNNLGNLQKNRNELDKAEESYNKSLSIYRELAEDNPQAFLPDVAVTLVNFSFFYLQELPDREKSIGYAEEVVEILNNFPTKTPQVEKNIETANHVLKKWKELEVTP